VLGLRIGCSRYDERWTLLFILDVEIEDESAGAGAGAGGLFQNMADDDVLLVVEEGDNGRTW